MAALTATKVTDREPVGNLFMQTFRATPGSAAADEYILTGFQTVLAVVGFAPMGATLASMNFVLNALGTGQTENTTQGALGVESSTTGQFQVTVLGR